MAIACLRLFTVPPLPPGPDLSVPRFLRRIALATVLLAALPYFLPPCPREDEVFFVGIAFLLVTLISAGHIAASKRPCAVLGEWRDARLLHQRGGGNRRSIEQFHEHLRVAA